MSQDIIFQYIIIYKKSPNILLTLKAKHLYLIKLQLILQVITL